MTNEALIALEKPSRVRQLFGIAALVLPLLGCGSSQDETRRVQTSLENNLGNPQIEVILSVQPPNWYQKLATLNRTVVSVATVKVCDDNQRYREAFADISSEAEYQELLDEISKCEGNSEDIGLGNSLTKLTVPGEVSVEFIDTGTLWLLDETCTFPANNDFNIDQCRKI